MKKTVIGIFVMITAISGIIYWETLGREKLLFSDILVLNRDVRPHTEITSDMLSKKSVYLPNMDAMSVQQAENLAGMVSVQYIHADTELFGEYFLREEQGVDEESGEFVFSMETNKLAAYPRSIKKGDRIYIYAGDSCVLDTVVLRTMDGTRETAAGCEDFEEETGARIETIEIKLNETEIIKLSQFLSENEGLTVAYN